MKKLYLFARSPPYMVAALEAAWSLLKALDEQQLYEQHGQGRVPVGFGDVGYPGTEQMRLGTAHPAIGGLLERLEDMRRSRGRDEDPQGVYDPEKRFDRFGGEGGGAAGGHGGLGSFIHSFGDQPSLRVDSGQMQDMLENSGKRHHFASQTDHEAFDELRRNTPEHELRHRGYPYVPRMTGRADPTTVQGVPGVKFSDPPIVYDNFPVGRYGNQRDEDGNLIMRFGSRQEHPKYDAHYDERQNELTNVIDDFEYGPIQLPQAPIPGVPGGAHHPHLDTPPEVGMIGAVRQKHPHMGNYGEPINILSTSRGRDGVARSGFYPPRSQHLRDMRSRGEDDDITSWHLLRKPSTDVYQGRPGDQTAMLPGSNESFKNRPMMELGQELAQGARPRNRLSSALSRIFNRFRRPQTNESQFDFAFDEPQYDLSGL